MKHIWLPMTAALMTSFSVLAQDIPNEKFSSSQIIADKKMSHDEVTDLYKDLDYDQIQTFRDQCHNSNRSHGVNTIGCELDTDRDGVFDHNDQCPETPKDRPVNFLGCAADTDNDGVIDPNDKCPLTPLGTRVDETGCKIDNDFDKDGVLNADDQCPDTPAGSKVNQNGCIPEEIALSNIVFDTASYEIREDQVSILQEDIKALKDLEAEEILLITGHTDSVGKESDNMTLSWNRAASVKNYLVSESQFEASRIYLLGAGESQPVASNETKQGRQQNRRIHLEVMLSNQLPKSAQVALP